MPFLFILSKNFCVFQRFQRENNFQLSTLNYQLSCGFCTRLIYQNQSHSVKNHHAYEDKNRMTKCAEWQSFIWLIFTASAKLSSCHEVDRRSTAKPGGGKNYVFSVFLSKKNCAFWRENKISRFHSVKKHHAYEDMNRMTKWAEWQSFIWLIFIALALCSFCLSV